MSQTSASPTIAAALLTADRKSRRRVRESASLSSSALSTFCKVAGVMTEVSPWEGFALRLLVMA